MPLGFQVGPLFVRYYGIILMLGALAGSWLAAQGAKRRDEDSELVWDGLVWVLIGGIIGARLWHIFTPTPSDIAIGLTTKFFAMWVDIAAPGLALGQAIGRWGNFINQELYGPPTDLPWGIFIEPQYRLPGFQEFERFHPLFLYESLWNFMNLGVLLWLEKKYKDKLKAGDLLFVYMIIYPVGRFLLEFIRLNSAEIGGINANQMVMLCVAVCSAVVLFIRHRRPDTPEILGE